MAKDQPASTRQLVKDLGITWKEASELVQKAKNQTSSSNGSSDVIEQAKKLYAENTKTSNGNGMPALQEAAKSLDVSQPLDKEAMIQKFEKCTGQECSGCQIL